MNCEHIISKLLCEGSHFGEISLIYKTKRTCSVICRNYNTMARLAKERFRVIKTDQPKFYSQLKENCTMYKDSNSLFRMECIKKIWYMKKLSKEIQFEIMYNLQEKFYLQDEMVLKQDDETDCIMIV